MLRGLLAVAAVLALMVVVFFAVQLFSDTPAERQDTVNCTTSGSGQAVFAGQVCSSP